MVAGSFLNKTQLQIHEHYERTGFGNRTMTGFDNETFDDFSHFFGWHPTKHEKISA